MVETWRHAPAIKVISCGFERRRRIESSCAQKTIKTSIRLLVTKLESRVVGTQSLKASFSPLPIFVRLVLRLVFISGRCFQWKLFHQVQSPYLVPTWFLTALKEIVIARLFARMMKQKKAEFFWCRTSISFIIDISLSLFVESSSLRPLYAHIWLEGNRLKSTKGKIEFFIARKRFRENNKT